MHEEPAYFELRFRPNVMLITYVRRFVSDFYRELLGSDDATSRLALATHELVENAVKYSCDGETRLNISLQHAGDRHQVQIVTRNRANPTNLEAVTQVLRGIERSTDAAQHYLEAMRKSATRTDGSGLGLARVWSEAEMTISYEIDGNEVAVRASTFA